MQKTLTSFVNDKESEVQQSTRATGGVTGPTVNLKCDATIEVYKYNHNKEDGEGFKDGLCWLKDQGHYDPHNDSDRYTKQYI